MNGRIDIKLGQKPTLTTAIHNYTASGGTTVNVDLSNYYNKVEIESKLDGKVDTIDGKGLSTNDYTTAEKAKLNSLSNYDDSLVKKTISDEVATRTNADNTLKNSINNEVTRATAAEAQLQKNIDGKTVDLSNYALSSDLTKYETIADHNTDVATLHSAIDSKLDKSQYQPTDLTPYYNKAEIESKLDNKVDMVEGKNLSSNDYTTAEKNKLSSLSNYDDSVLKNSISTEAARATAAELQLQKNIDGKTVDLSNYALSSDLTKYEASSAHSADITTLQTAIDSKLNKSDYTSVDLSNFYKKAETDVKLSSKVDVVEGKNLSTNDYTTIEKTKLQGLSNYDDSAIKNSIADETERAEAAEVILQKNIDGKQDKGNYVSASQLSNYETIIGHNTDITTLQSAIDSKLNKSDYHVADLTNYYKKTETSGATQIAAAISAIPSIKVLTQAEYDAIVTKSNNTTYIITT